MGRIPTARILERLEALYAKREIEDAERHLLYWLAEAKAEGDIAGEYQMHNELMGHYRKNGRRDEAIEHAEAALSLLETLDISDSVSGGVARLNAATVYKAFSMPEQSLSLFIKAKEILERLLPSDDAQLAGLYNNMGLCLVDLGRYAEARTLYEKAIAIMQQKKDGKPDVAITYLNLANLVEAEQGLEDGEGEITRLLDLAWEDLNDPTNKQDGYLAFVLEKCAPTFGYYGRFGDEADLSKKSGELYGKGT